MSRWVKIPGSECKHGNAQFSMYESNGETILAIEGPAKALHGFSGTRGGRGELLCPLDHANAVRLRQALPFTAPVPVAGNGVTFGLGDRLGLAGCGHLRAVRGFDAMPVLAQQSVRELELMGRDYGQVLDAATWAVFREGFRRPWGADGDHLKSEEWVRTALQAGYTMITADVSDFIRRQYLEAQAGELRVAYEALEPDYRRRIEQAYLGRELSLDTGEKVVFSEEELPRTSVVYGEAIEQARRLYRSGVEAKGEGGFDFELSVDETEAPTAPTAHAFAALEAKAADIRLSSLAPRFIGEFQKGVDYIGDPQAFARSIRTHASLARVLGHHLSIHSGSDKFAVFPAIGRETLGRFHIKTSGTSWLEAVRVTAVREPALYRELHRRALERFPNAARYYHVTTNLSRIPDLKDLADADLPDLLAQRDARQLVHITYGELMKDQAFKDHFFSALRRNREEYWAALERHIGRHLEALGIPRL
jgi:hypothetical protein